MPWARGVEGSIPLGGAGREVPARAWQCSAGGQYWGPGVRLAGVAWCVLRSALATMRAAAEMRPAGRASLERVGAQCDAYRQEYRFTTS